MCKDASFVQTRDGRIYDGLGLTHSHSAICALHGLDEDKLNKYEWNPQHGLVLDREVFTPGKSHHMKLVSYVNKLKKNWERHNDIRWDALRVALPQVDIDRMWQLYELVGSGS